MGNLELIPVFSHAVFVSKPGKIFVTYFFIGEPVIILLPIFFTITKFNLYPLSVLGELSPCRNINRFKFEIIDVFAMRLLEYDRVILGIFLVILSQKH